MSRALHCILTPVGSGGDVFPYIGLGRRLRARGHAVTLLAAEPFRPHAEQAGLRFEPVWDAAAFDRAVRNPDLWHSRRGLRVVFRAVVELTPRTYGLLAARHEPGRTVLVGHTLAFATRTFEDTHRVQAVTIHLAPNAFRSDFAQPALPDGTDLTGAPVWLKRAIWWALDRAGDRSAHHAGAQQVARDPWCAAG